MAIAPGYTLRSMFHKLHPYTWLKDQALLPISLLAVGLFLESMFHNAFTGDFIRGAGVATACLALYNSSTIISAYAAALHAFARSNPPFLNVAYECDTIAERTQFAALLAGLAYVVSVVVCAYGCEQAPFNKDSIYLCCSGVNVLLLFSALLYGYGNILSARTAIGHAFLNQ